MSEEMRNSLEQSCPQCGNHCPLNALQCGRGRKYFGADDSGHDHHHHMDGLSGLIHQCSRFVHHTDWKEEEVFQALTDEEKATLQALLEKLAADWKERCGESSFAHGGHHGHGGEKHHHKHGDHDK